MAHLFSINSNRDLCDLITALGILFAALGFFMSVRANYVSIINKCTAEFRTIVRKIQHGKMSIVNQKIARKDLCGLFNEQLYYIHYFYIPCKIRKEWKSTIKRYLLNEVDGIKIEKEDFADYPRLVKLYHKAKAHN